MEFELALRLLKGGYKVKLKAWDNGLFLMTHNGCIYKWAVGCNGGSEWKPDSLEVLSNQWECVDGIDYFDQGFADGYAVGWDEALKKYNEVIYGTTLPDDVKKYRKEMVKQLRIRVRKKTWKKK